MNANSAALGQEQILMELADIGFSTTSLSSLRTSRIRYSDAIPLLVRWLELATDPKLKGEIVRALSVPWARSLATRPLIEEFRRVSNSVDPTGTGLGWTIGNALEVLADDAVFAEIVELVQDTSYGQARQMIVLGLGKSKRPEAVEVLLGLIDDPDVDGHAVKALSKLRSPKAREALELKVGDSRAWVRGAARKGLAKLDDSAAR